MKVGEEQKDARIAHITQTLDEYPYVFLTVNVGPIIVEHRARHVDSLHDSRGFA